MDTTTYTVYTARGTKVLETHSYSAASQRASYLARQHGSASLEADGEPLCRAALEYLDRVCAGRAVGEYRNPTREEIEDAQHFAAVDFER